MSLKMGPFMVDEYKQEWKNIMERRYGAGNCPTTGPDCFEAWLSGQVYSLRGNLAFIKDVYKRQPRDRLSLFDLWDVPLPQCGH